MSNSTITNPTVQEASYNAAGYDMCPTLKDNVFKRNVTLSSGYVTSYRGRPDFSKNRAFDRYKFLVSGEPSVWFCDSNNKVWGGTNFYLSFFQNGVEPHPMLSCLPDAFSITSKDERYRTHMVAELYSKANEAVFNSATFFAELGESVVYITDLLRSILRMTKFTKDIIHRGANPDEAWLEWRYAIQPLMLTIEDVLAALQPRRPKEKVQHGNVAEPIVESYQWTNNFSAGSLSYHAKATTRIKCGSALWIRSQNDASPWGTSLNDVIAAGWEIVPASFIYDWFFDVGTWLGSLRDTNLDVGERYATLVKETTVDAWIDEGSSSAIATSYTLPTPERPLRVFAYHINRTVGDDVAPNSLPCIVPGKLSLIHKLDALALLVSLLKGLRR